MKKSVFGKVEVIDRKVAISKLTQYVTVDWWGEYSNKDLESFLFDYYNKYFHIKRWFEFWY